MPELEPLAYRSAGRCIGVSGLLFMRMPSTYPTVHVARIKNPQVK